MIGVDDFMRNGRHIGQETQPAKRIGPLNLTQATRCLGCRPTDAMVAIAANHKISLEPMRLLGEPVADARTIALNIVYRDVLCFVDGLQTQGLAGPHHVSRDLGLPIDHDRPPC